MRFFSHCPNRRLRFGDLGDLGRSRQATYCTGNTPNCPLGASSQYLIPCWLAVF
jgi:hypothetical protein